jgi:hypothetical protein
MLIANTMAAVQREGHDLAAMLTRALRPKASYVAITPKPWEMPEEEWARVKASLLAAGFSYDGSKREWRRTMAIADAAELPFKVKEVAA